MSNIVFLYHPWPLLPKGGDYAGCSNVGPRILLFYVFARRRGDFAEMMGVRGEARGACSPELTSSQTSRHAVPTASTGVFSVFFYILVQGQIVYSFLNNNILSPLSFCLQSSLPMGEGGGEAWRKNPSMALMLTDLLKNNKKKGFCAINFENS